MPKVGQRGVLQGYNGFNHEEINDTPFVVREVYDTSFQITISSPSKYAGTYTIDLAHAKFETTGQLDLFDA